MTNASGTGGANRDALHCAVAPYLSRSLNTRMLVLYTLTASSVLSGADAQYTFASFPVLTQPCIALNRPRFSSLNSTNRVRGSRACSTVARSCKLSHVSHTQQPSRPSGHVAPDCSAVHRVCYLPMMHVHERSRYRTTFLSFTSTIDVLDVVSALRSSFRTADDI